MSANYDYYRKQRDKFDALYVKATDPKTKERFKREYDNYAAAIAADHKPKG